MRIEVDGREVLLDDEDAYHLTPGNLYISSTGYLYVRRYAGKKNGYSSQHHYSMARLIMGLRRCSPDEWDVPQVDHINRNRLDNRKANLRVISWQANRRNTGKRSWSGGPGGRARQRSSTYRGVSLDTRDGRWRVSFRVGGKQIHRRFPDELVAAAWALEVRAQYLEALERSAP